MFFCVKQLDKPKEAPIGLLNIWSLTWLLPVSSARSRLLLLYWKHKSSMQKLEGGKLFSLWVYTVESWWKINTGHVALSLPQEMSSPMRGFCSFSIYLCIWVVRLSPPGVSYTAFVKPPFLKRTRVSWHALHSVATVFCILFIERNQSGTYESQNFGLNLDISLSIKKITISTLLY